MKLGVEDLTQTEQNLCDFQLEMIEREVGGLSNTISHHFLTSTGKVFHLVRLLYWNFGNFKIKYKQRTESGDIHMHQFNYNCIYIHRK